MKMGGFTARRKKHILEEIRKEIVNFGRELNEEHKGISIIQGNDVNGWFIHLEQHFAMKGIKEERLQLDAEALEGHAYC